ncbi:carbohydrate ABC transporter permease [Oceanispirochaeta sp. M2]|nr:sugar ABC transporter permease [Oceanispirochaeta sp. M2]
MRSMMNERKSKILISYLFVLPALLFVVVFLLIPMIQNVYYSFFAWNGLSKPIFIGLKNFQKCFVDPNFVRSFMNTIIWVVFTLLVPVSFALLVAVFLKEIKGGSFFKGVFFIPLTISFVSTGVIWINMFSTKGVLNTIITAVTRNPDTVSWLTQVPLNTIAMLIAWTWQQMGVYMVLFLMGLTTIPQDPIEAAVIDGANKFQIFKAVTFPMLQPITTVVITQAIVNSFKTFDLIYVITHGGPYRSSETMAVTMYRETFSMFNMGYGAAISLVLSAIIIIISGGYVKSQLKQDLLHY